MLIRGNVHKNKMARRFAGAKAQSAMEYLMTYGWAILIIAVVLGALFQLGVFNANNFAPKRHLAHARSSGQMDLAQHLS